MSSGRARRTAAIAALVLLTLAVTEVSGTTRVLAATDRVRPPARGQHATSIGDAVGSEAGTAFREQKPDWTPCLSRRDDPGLPSGYYRQECATLTAPMDWRDPNSGATVKLAVSRLPATDKAADKAAGKASRGVLFTNPGGPGGAGVDLPLLFLSDERKAITRSQDVYGMDVRGTGASANVTCGGASSTTLDPRDRGGANLNLILDGARYLARACDTAGGALIDLVDTEQTVQDIELLRSVIGAPKINWLGYSAGTWLGAHYATAFPGRVGHMVLDSNTDFTGGWQGAFDLQPMGFERRFREDFLPWVAKYHSTYRLGRTAAAVEASYERIRAGLTPQRPVNSAVTLDQFMAGAMYAKAMFPLAALILQDFDTAVKAQQASRPRAARHAFTRADRRSAQLRRMAPLDATSARRPMSSDASDATFLAVTCNDSGWGDAGSLVAKSAVLGEKYPLIGYSTIFEPCAFWNRPAVHLDTPTGEGVPPVLMVQAVRDPATPIEGARRSLVAFAGARMLTVTDEGDHGQYASGNACVDAAVEAFIVHGTLPARDKTCRGLPLPTPDSYGYRSAAGRSPQPSLRTTRGLPAKGTNPLLALHLLHHTLR